MLTITAEYVSDISVICKLMPKEWVVQIYYYDLGFLLINIQSTIKQ
jgi:hypothetical protein